MNFTKNSFFDELVFVLGNATIFIDIVEASDINRNEKKFILRLFHFLYLVRIHKHLEEIIRITVNEPLHASFHRRIDELMAKVDENYVKFID